MNWKQANILFIPELEALQLIADYRGWSTVAEIYLSKKIKQRLLTDAVISCRVVDSFFEKIYVKEKGNEQRNYF